MLEKQIDIKDFALRVERLCDFLLNKIDIKDGSDDVVIIQKLKDDAADLQFEADSMFFKGLNEYIHGG